MRLISVLSNSLKCNSYILANKKNEAVVIDCGDESLIYELKYRNLLCKYVLLTHGHFDHTGGAARLSEEGAKIFCGENEKDFIFSKENLGIFKGMEIPFFKIDKTFSDGVETELCGIKIKVLSTPGHTCGSVCYVVENMIFTGDTLFKLGVGRTDLPTGSEKKLKESLKKLFALSDNYELYCGHGCPTKLENERKYNPYARII